MCSPTEKYQIDSPKRAVGSPEILIFLHTQFVVAPFEHDWPLQYDTTLASSESLELQSLSLYMREKNMHNSQVYAILLGIRMHIRCLTWSMWKV